MSRKDKPEPAQPPLFDTTPGGPLLPPRETLEEVWADVAEQRCAICHEGDPIIFGSGAPQAQLMLVGEAPAPDDEVTGQPFSGPSGQLLAKILAAIGYHRDQCYLCNVIKCRPRPGHAPSPEEIETCKPYLMRQIAAVRPRVIIALGGLAAQSIINTKAPISRLRGKFIELDGIKVMPTYNPAYLLRVPDKKREVWEDVKQVKAYLERYGG